MPVPPPSVAAERPDLSNIDPDLLSYITKQEFGNLPVNDKTKGAIASVMKYRYTFFPLLSPIVLSARQWHLDRESDRIWRKGTLIPLVASSTATDWSSFKASDHVLVSINQLWCHQLRRTNSIHNRIPARCWLHDTKLLHRLFNRLLLLDVSEIRCVVVKRDQSATF